MNAATGSAAEPRVTVIVISYNSSATLPQCLACLAAQTFRAFRLVLVDNLSATRPGHLLKGLPFPVTYLEMTKNLGFAEGMNRGIAAASASPLIAALNPDAYADPYWLAELVAAADRHAGIAAFGSLQLNAADPTVLDGFGDHYLLSGQAWRGRTLPPAPTVEEPDGQPEYCFGVCAAAALYRTEALRDIGGFDARFFCFYEDVDVAFRLRLAGHHCAVIRAAIVRHVGGASFTGKSAFAERLTARNAWWVLIKNMPILLLIIAVPAFWLIQLLAAVKNPQPDRLQGLSEAFARTGEFWASRRQVQSRRQVSTAAINQWLTWHPSAFLGKQSITRPGP